MTPLFFSAYEAGPDSNDGSPRPLVSVGAGGLGREIALLISQLNAAGAGRGLRGFYDDRRPAAPAVGGLPYLGTVATATAIPLAVAVGSSAGRAAVVRRLTSGHLAFPVLVHPRVALAAGQRIRLPAGCLIQRGCLLTCGITLGRFGLLNLGCTLGHDSVLEDFCSLMPHANVGGAAHLEAGVYLGANATVIHQVRVGAHTTVGARAVVVRDLPAGCTAVGVPAREIKRLE